MYGQAGLAEKIWDTGTDGQIMKNGIKFTTMKARNASIVGANFGPKAVGKRFVRGMIPRSVMMTDTSKSCGSEANTLYKS